MMFRISRRFMSSVAILLLPVGLVVLLAVVVSQLSSHSDAAKVGPQPDYITGSWSAIATFPAVTLSPTPGANPLKIKRAAAVAYPPNGKIYLLGGRHGTDGEDWALNKILEYDPSSDAWSVKAAIIDPAGGSGQCTQNCQGFIFGANMAAGVLTDSSNNVRIYAIGGASVNSLEVNTVRVYDPVADSITTLPDDPWPITDTLRVPGGYAVYNNRMYLFGGFSYQGGSGGLGQVFTDTWRFDPTAPTGSKWTQLPSANLSLGRAYIASAVVDGKLYAVGGDKYTPGNPGTLVPVTNVEMLDLTQPNPSWVSVANLPTARGDMGAWGYDTGTGHEISGKVAVAGGLFPTPDNTGYLYDPQTNSWSAFPNMVYATRNYGYTELNGFLYALGGYDYTNNTPSGANFNQRYDASGPPTATPTGTLPTSTNTPLPSNTPIATPTSCGTNSNYAIATGTATIVPGTTDTGNHCDDCLTLITLPFPYTLYGQTYTTANVDSNGTLQFVDNGSQFSTSCLPASGFSYIIFPYWADLYTVNSGYGIFTSISGTAPNRIFNIEWRDQHFPGTGTVNFEARLYEGQNRFDLIYGLVDDQGTSGTVGVQQDDVDTHFTQFECGTGGLTNGLLLTFTQATCVTGTPVPPTDTPLPPTNTPVPPTDTPVLPTDTPIPPTIEATNTQVPPTATQVPSTDTPAPPTGTPTAATDTPAPPTPSATACTVSFDDVPVGSTFYQYIRCLACLGVVDGYPDGTFRPLNEVTRGQLSKMASNSAGFHDNQTTQMFQDVPIGSPFFQYIGRLASRGFISGYTCGGSGEPCGPSNLPYYRPYGNVTRGQFSKIVSNAAGYNDPPVGQQFEDIPPGSVWYTTVYRLVVHHVIQGYPCGGSGEPCGPGNLPYYRPNADSTRGQIAKVMSQAFFPDCNIPER